MGSGGEGRGETGGDACKVWLTRTMRWISWMPAQTAIRSNKGVGEAESRGEKRENENEGKAEREGVGWKDQSPPGEAEAAGGFACTRRGVAIDTTRRIRFRLS